MNNDEFTKARIGQFLEFTRAYTEFMERGEYERAAVYARLVVTIDPAIINAMVQMAGKTIK